MKITNVYNKLYKWPRSVPITNGLYTYTHNSLDLIIIETDDPDVTGIGIAGNTPGGNVLNNASSKIAEGFVEYFKGILVGLDPLDNEALWHAMWKPKLVGRRG